jgi:hypothetical protein
MPPAAQLVPWLQVFFWLISSAGVVVGLLVGVKKLREKSPTPAPIPQPFTVTPHVEFTPVEDHARLQQDFKEFIAKTDERFGAMSRASSASREKIFDLIREQMAATRKEFKEEITALTSRISDTLIALGRAEGELRANRARSASEE